MSPLLKTLTVATLLACAACAAGTPQAGSRAPARGGSALITQQEVQESPARNAHEVVQFLRPRWLQKQGVVAMRSDGDVVAYLDDTRLGGTDALRQVEKTVIKSVRYYDPTAAQARFGLDHSYGAIQVISERP